MLEKFHSQPSDEANIDGEETYSIYIYMYVCVSVSVIIEAVSFTSHERFILLSLASIS